MKKKTNAILTVLMVILSVLAFASCAKQIVNDDDDKTLVGVYLENVPTEAIDLGKFDEQTEVYLRLEYDDYSFARKRITQSFFAEEYQHYFEEVGTHEFEIMYRGFTLKFAVTFKDPTKYFTVEFWNVSDEVVSEQTVKEGENAVAPTEEEMYVEGWRFLGTYDTPFDEVEKDLIVKGEYVKTWNVSFYNNNNELIKSYIVDDKAASPEPTEEERAVEGYTFVSWDRTFGEITKDKNVYGIYKKNETTHDYEIAEQKAATCTDDGYIKYKCKICDDEYTVEIKALGHDYKATVTAATCTAYGYTTYVCKVCGNYYTGDYVNPLGHKYAETERKDATCTENGYIKYKCGECSDEKEQVIIADGHYFGYDNVCDKCGYVAEIHEHDYVAKVVAPGCTTMGYTDYVCECGASYRADLIEPTGHKFNGGEIIKAKTCTEDGKIRYTCTVCGEKYEEVITFFPEEFTL
ncbi:MAG: hypothetical protein J6N93_06485, partial [Clostridia bacterium]|nr:hypothetical protein [Clostridia bacterium]